MTDQTGEGGRQFGGYVAAAGFDQRTQAGERAVLARFEGAARMLPLRVDLCAVARGAEHQIGIQPDQAVASADFAAFDRFEQEVAAAFLEQLDGGANRRFSIGDHLAPHQRGPALRQRRACPVGAFQRGAQLRLSYR